MADYLTSQVAGATRPSQTILWRSEDDTALDLTGATITGCLINILGESRVITGALIVTNGQLGQFRWDYSATDVQEGSYWAQFTATFALPPLVARSKMVQWTVNPAIC